MRFGERVGLGSADYFSKQVLMLGSDH